jgi:hypothetical protein
VSNELPFDIPIAIFFFNRPDLFEIVLKEVSKIKPSKLYLISDGPRKDRPKEKDLVENCRRIADEIIDWPCEVKKNYSKENRGVYENIAGGAQWVFNQEEMAIFLEDDNYPESSFFEYCRELLIKYKDDTRVFWISGNNFLTEYEPADNASYIFTKHLHPCGWASWNHKFLNYYDGHLNLWDNVSIRKRVMKQLPYILNRASRFRAWDLERHLYLQGKRQHSWDFQWHFSIYANSAYGIVPKYNLIRNIGVDERATHGATKMTKEVSKYVPQKMKRLEFPLVHPPAVLSHHDYEMKMYKLIKPPFSIKLFLFYLLKYKNIFGEKVYEKIMLIGSLMKKK